MKVEEAPNFVISRLESIMAKKNLSKYRLAKNADMCQSSLTNLMNRNNIPTLVSLQKICDGLGITLAQFFAEGDEIPNLTKEQKDWLALLTDLSTIEKEKVMAYIQGLKDSR